MKQTRIVWIWLTDRTRNYAPLLLALALWLSFGAFSSASAQAPAGQSSPTEIKSHLKEVLSSPEFAPASMEDTPLQRLSKWLHQQWDAFWRWVEKLFRGMGQGATVGPGMSYTFTILFILLGLALIVWLIARYVKTAKNKKAAARTAFDLDDPEEAMITEPDVWLSHAENYAGGNDYRRAFRAVFLAILLQLDQAGIIEFDRSRTNGDYLRLLRSKGLTAIYAALEPLVLEFDLRWYGNKPTSETDYKHCLEEYHRMRERLAPSEEPAAATRPTAAAGGKA